MRQMKLELIFIKREADKSKNIKHKRGPKQAKGQANGRQDKLGKTRINNED